MCRLGHPGAVHAVAGPDARWLLAGGSDGSGQLWGAQRSVATILPHPMAVTSVVLTPDGRRVVTGCADGTARVWKISPAQEVP
ncbi:MAG: WD40 repeat domain-containing protein [Pseudonocardiaceae bacterium]